MPSKYRNVSATLLRIFAKSKGLRVAVDGDSKDSKGGSGGDEGCGAGIGGGRLDEANFKDAGSEVEDICK